MRDYTHRTPEADEDFLNALRAGRSVAGAARAAGYLRRTVYSWRQFDPEFKAAWDEAVEEGTDLLEDRAFARTEESDTLTIFMLKARRPEKYREVVRQQITGADDGPLQIEAVTHLQRAKAAAALFARMRALPPPKSEDEEP